MLKICIKTRLFSKTPYFTANPIFLALNEKNQAPFKAWIFRINCQIPKKLAAA
jgi:hypothetical protein